MLPNLLEYSLVKCWKDFKNHWIEFNSDAKMKQWTGTTPTDKYINHYGGYNGD